MQMAIDVAGFTPGEADQLRQAMGSKRSQARMARDARPADGGHGRAAASPATTAEEIAHKLEAFADFGFPESHSVSFAYLVYSSSWIKLHYPAEFACRAAQRAADGLLLAAHDRARRRAATASRCSVPTSTRRDATARSSRAPMPTGPVGRPVPGWHADPSIHAVRLGLRYVRGLHDALLDRIDDERARATVPRPRGLRPPHRRARRRARGARDRGRVRACFGRRPPRRRCGPRARCARRARRRRTLPGVVTGLDAPALPGMTEIGGGGRRPVGDGPVAGPAPHRVRPRASSPRRGVVTAAALRDAARPHGRRGGRGGDPPPAAGDGQGHGLPQPRGRDRPRERDLHARRLEAVPAGGARSRRRCVVRGVLERHQGVINLLARRIDALPLSLADALQSRDFH